MNSKRDSLACCVLPYALYTNTPLIYILKINLRWAHPSCTRILWSCLSTASPTSVLAAVIASELLSSLQPPGYQPQRAQGKVRFLEGETLRHSSGGWAWTRVFRPSASAWSDKQEWLWVHIYTGGKDSVSYTWGVPCCYYCLGIRDYEYSKLKRHSKPSCTADKRMKRSQGVLLPRFSNCILSLPGFIKSQLLLIPAQVWEDIVTSADKRRLNVINT